MRLPNIGNMAVSRIAVIALLLLMTMTALHLVPTTASAAQAALSWSAPTTYTDGTPLTAIGGYTLHVGTAAGSYSQHIQVGNVTQYTVASLEDSTKYYFSVSASDTYGVSSKPSNEVSMTTPTPPPSPALYTLTASAGSGGSITPSGAIVISQGSSQTFAIAPATGYKIAGVTVDGTSVGAVSSYTFSNVAASHTIAASFASTATAATWQNQAIAPQTGTFTAIYTATPGANNIDAVSGCSPAQASAYTGMATQVRFNTAGNIDARNGGTYAARTALPYSGGKSYRIRMVVNVPTHKYDVYVTPSGGTEVQLAAGYSFRTEQATAPTLSYFSSYAGTGTQTLSGLSVTSNSAMTASSKTWQNQPVSSQSGTFTASFDLIPGANNIDAVTGFSPLAAKAYSDLAAAIRFNTAGTMDVRNGSAYAAKTALSYSAGKSYRVRMLISVSTRKYDVYVTPPGGAEIQLAAGYAFRTEQAAATALNNVSIYAGTGSHQLQNLSLK